MRAEFDQDKVEKIRNEEQGIPPANIDVKDEVTLVSYIDNCWEEALKAKTDHAEVQILANMKQIDGEYDSTKLSAIKEIGGSEVFMMITDAKCKNASNWVDELMFQPNQHPWDVAPTPIPELPNYVMEEIYKEAMAEIIASVQAEAQRSGMMITPQMVMGKVMQTLPKIQEEMKNIVYEKAQKMAEAISQEIDDKLTEGGWYSALKTCIPNVIMHTGFITGPIPKKRSSIKIKPMSDGKLVAHIIEEIIPTWESAHPLDIYPSPDSTNINDGYLFHRLKLTPKVLQELIDVPTYEEDEIREVLKEAEEGKLENWLSVDQELADIHDSSRPYSYDSKKIEALKFMGDVKGKDITDWSKAKKGPDGKKLDADFYYNIILYKIGSHIISVQFNKDPLGRKPYYKASFEEVDGSFWGKGLPQVIKDVQGICNAMARAIVNNAGMGCLTGDSIVYREGQNFRKHSEITLKELWDKKSKHNSGLRRIKLRSLNTDVGEFFSNRIVEVFNNGIADIYEVITEKGYKIKATGTHRFMDDVGEWKELDNFDVGDLIAVNGSVKKPIGKCIECGENTSRVGVKCRKCASKLQNSKWNQKQVETSRENFDVNGTTARARLDCKSKKKSFCELCGEREMPLEQHHKDRTPWNNTDENLQTLCSFCHHKLHAVEDSIGDGYLHKYVSYDTIISIEYIGKEVVYNLHMTAPYHNFIVNGFVSKNSGPQVERNIDRIPPSERAENKLIPWKVWDVTGDMMAGPAPALKFYQPPMVVERLMNVYQAFSKIADEHSGVPAFAHGDPNVGGAGSTASGLSMLMGSAARGIKAIIKSIDEYIIKPSVERQYFWLIERKPYYKTSFEEVDGSFWGRGLPQIIKDVQGVCNAMARAIVNNAGMACLTGDSLVYYESKTKKYSPVTLLELWNKKHGRNPRGLKCIKLRSLNMDTGEFFGNKIMDVYNNGTADIFEVVTERGYTVRATGTHRFMNDVGEWQELDEFDTGDLIAVNGRKTPFSPICIDCGKKTKGRGVRCLSCSRKASTFNPDRKPKICIECGDATTLRGVCCRKCASKIANSSWNKKQNELSRTNDSVSYRRTRARYDCLSNKKIFCEMCGENLESNIELRLEIHHRNRDPWDNKKENLQTLCAACHHETHRREDSFGDAYLHKYLSYDTIISIEYIGKETVYNLHMTAPYHNFIVNGFISKNSGPQIERNIDRIPPSERAENKLIPWKVWDVTGDMMAGPAPALKFYQPPMVVERLMNVYQAFSKIADEHSGVPAFTHGDPNVGGAGSTASGLSMLMGSAARGIKAIIKSIDEYIIKPSVERQYFWLIERKDYFGMVCDYQIVSGGTMAALAREQMAARRIEFMNATANPVDAQIMGMEGRKYVLDETAKSVNMDLDKYMSKKLALPPPPQPGEEGAGGFGPTGAGTRTLDAAGAPVVGQDFRQFNK